MRRLLGLLAGAQLLLAGCAANKAAPSADPAVPYQQGLDAKNGGRNDEAMASFRAALQKNPAYLPAWRSLVQLYAETNRLSEIRGELQEKLRTAPSDDALHYALGLAEFAEAKTAGDEALVEFHKACELKPAEAEYHFRLGVALLELERYPEALPELQKATELSPADAKLHVPLGLCLAKLGQRAPALEQFRALLQLHPSARDVKLAQQAIDRLDDPLRDVPKSEAATFQRGMDWLYRADAPQPAIDAFEEILAKYPDLAPVHTVMGLAYERLDDAGPAVEHLRRAIELKPEDATPYQYLADLYYSKEKADSAESYYRQALDRNPLLDHAYERLGDMAAHRGNGPEALTDFKALAALRPDDPSAHKRLASGYELNGQFDFALTEVQGVLDKKPNDLDAQLHLGMVYMALANHAKSKAERKRLTDEGEAAFQKVLDVQPDNVAASRAIQQIKALK